MFIERMTFTTQMGFSLEDWINAVWISVLLVNDV